MPPSPEDALLSPETIVSLAVLYDKFANALDPFAPQRDQAEAIFDEEVLRLYDFVKKARLQLDFHSFRKGIILRCRRHLKGADKPASI
ncbi:MAG: hypothetical protein HY360_15325 [Verrucomicrobia bacterium]|nr:hypothetical protein [Verrucomicrobiota bacterium]